MNHPHVHMAAALAALVSTAAGATQIQCQNEIVDGVTVCAANMASYATKNGQPVCPPGVTSTGSALICEESLDAALNDAAGYLSENKTGPTTYYIAIDPGIYDFSSETRLPNRKGAIDVSFINPRGATGCLTPAAAQGGTVALSGGGCLVLSGTSRASTILVTPNGVSAIHGSGTSHLLVANMTMRQALDATTQGTFVAAGTRTFDGHGYPTITLDISPGFPSPLDLFIFNCGGTPPGGCTKEGIEAASNDVYMRAYTNAAAPQLIKSVSFTDRNAQEPFGFPSYLGTRVAVAPPTQPDSVNYPYRWEITFSNPIGGRAVPTAYSGTTNGVANLVCMKYDHAQAFWFGGGTAGSTDIIFSNMRWIGGSRGTFRHVTASAESGTPGGQIYNSAISRAAPINGQVPCLSTQSGGMQFGQPGDPPVFGNIVDGLHSEASGDDTIAMFNDIGGQPNGHGGFYPQSIIRNSPLGNSFARDINLYNDQRFSHFAGKSPVYVDALTKRFINMLGHCDPIIAGRGNCPVRYEVYVPKIKKGDLLF
jgi:hypothetical protein